MVVALAIIFTWVFNHTRGSVFIATLLHASIDTPQLVWIPLFLAVGMTSLNLAALIGFGVPALLIVILTRGRLGYQPSQGSNGREHRGTPGRSADWQGRATSPCAAPGKRILPMPGMIRQKSMLSLDRAAPVWSVHLARVNWKPNTAPLLVALRFYRQHAAA